MTLFEICNNLKNIALEKNNINYAGDGDIYILNSSPDTDYSVFFITQNTHNVSENTITYSLNLFYIDRLTENKDNMLKIQSDGMLSITNIVNEFNERYDDVEITYPLQFQVFNQRFADECAGVWCVANIICRNDIGICDYN